jgi:hypothetical protein
MMIVNRLPLIIVLGTGETRLLRQRLRRLIGLESPEKLLFALGLGGSSQAAIAEH